MSDLNLELSRSPLGRVCEQSCVFYRFERVTLVLNTRPFLTQGITKENNLKGSAIKFEVFIT